MTDILSGGWGPSQTYFRGRLHKIEPAQPKRLPLETSCKIFNIALSIRNDQQKTS